MTTAGRTSLTWLGRLFLLAIVFVVVCNFFYPQGISFLEPAVCPEGLAIETNSRQLSDARDITSSYALICTSDNRLVDASDRLFGVLAVLSLSALAAYMLRNRITPRSLSAPVAPPHQ